MSIAAGNSLLPTLNGTESLQESDNKIFQDMMGDLALGPVLTQLFDLVVTKAANSTETTQGICQAVGQVAGILAKDTIETGKNFLTIVKRILPASVTEPVTHCVNEMLAPIARAPKMWQEKYGIPEQQTIATLLSMTLFIPFVDRCKFAFVSNKVGNVRKQIFGFFRSDSGAVAIRPGVVHPIVERTFSLEMQRFEAILEVAFQKQYDQSLAVWIRGLYAINSKTDFFFATGSTSTTGISFLAMQALKNLAKEQKTNTMYLQWSPANTRLLEIAKKSPKVKYLGDHPNFLKEKGGYLGNYPVFKFEIAPGKINPIIPIVVLGAIGETVHATTPSKDHVQMVRLLQNTSSELFKDMVVRLRETSFAPPTCSFSDEEYKTLLLTRYFADDNVFFDIDHALSSSIIPLPALPVSRGIFPEIYTRDIDIAADKVLEYLGSSLIDATGIPAAIEDIRDFKNMICLILENPLDAPMLIANKLVARPEAILRGFLDTPEVALSNIRAFITTPGFTTAFGVLTSVVAVISVVAAIIPLLELVNRAVKENLLRAPLFIVKELVHMGIGTVKRVVQLGKDLIRNPVHTAENLFQSIIKAPGHALKRIEDGIRHQILGKKKKERQIIYPVQIVAISPEILIRQLVEIAADCFITAQGKWMVAEDKPFDVYLQDLYRDWKSAQAKGLFSGDPISFVGRVLYELQNENLSAIRQLTPFAHTSEFMAPWKVVQSQASVQLAHIGLQQIINQRQIETNRLTATTAVLKQNTVALSNSTQKINQVLDDKGERIKAALLARKQASAKK